MHSPSTYTDSLNDQDDLVYPCKGCGEILEEGKAFELAGSRWHIDCFRCNTCGTLLDSDANLLLLGDGSLICNNCTYSCNACGNKIEDLAILTGDQAFCASCFRCRNCKRKIENLRYARTSAGIFCMACHETLMARRRKRAKGTPRSAASGRDTGPAEKALPSLPPGAASSSAFNPEAEAPSADSLAGSAPARQNSASRAHRDAAPQHASRSDSPPLDSDRKDTNTLPASTYDGRRSSNVSDETDDGEESGFLPMAFDPNPVAPPIAVPRKQVPSRTDATPPIVENNRPRDYFGRTNSRSQRDPVRDIVREEGRTSRASSVDHDKDSGARSNPPKVSPHIAYQEIGRNAQRDTSGTSTPSGLAAGVSSDSRPHERTKSQLPDMTIVTAGNTVTSEVLRHNSQPGSRPVPSVAPLDTSTKSAHKAAAASPESLDSPMSGVNPFDDPMRRDHSILPTIAPAASQTSTERTSREESLSTLNIRVKSPESDVSSLGTSPAPRHDRRTSTSSARSSLADVAAANTRKSVEGPPPRAPGRMQPVGKSYPTAEYSGTRSSPAPMTSTLHRHHDSISTMQSSDGRISPAIHNAALPQHTTDEPFSMEEEMSRILRGESRRDSQANEATGGGMLRRVSNAVKHGRSFSDRGLTSAGKIQATPESLSIDTSAPMSTANTPSATGQSSLDQMRAQLRRANQRIAELEAEKSGLQDKVDSSAEITAASNELREKRNTMVVLDTQREMVVAELESMTAHLQKAKDSGKPLDLNTLRTDISRDFADALHKVKSTFSRQIEDLIHKRNELTEEIGTLIQMKDKGFQEYESLSSKNSQLLEMNNQLIQNMHGAYKSGANGKVNGANGAANGLGIHSVGPRPDVVTPSLDENDAEAATLVSAPQVVNIRKGQPKKFNWRKGGEKMAKNVTKGIKGAFVGEKTPSTPYGDIGLPYNFTQVATAGEPIMMNGRPPGAQQGGAGYNIFGSKGAPSKTQRTGSITKDTSSSNLVAAAEASVLFGSELEERCEHERRLVPSVISRCIEEVEARGMDVEGIYRKSGGSGQVKSVQQGFEKDGKFDISDPDLDIHAVTSALKQYFRKLPTPLITYDVYESLLEAAQMQDQEKQIIALRASMSELPDAHRNCLEYLVHHLGRVVQHEKQNLMTPLNISVVFAPTIMRPRSIEREMSDMQAQRAAVQALLEHHQDIFNIDD